MWLRYMFAYSKLDGLFLGRAIPRAWLADGHQIGITRVATHFGEVSVRYTSQAAKGRISVAIGFKQHTPPGRVVARIRHPENRPIRAARVNGKLWEKVNPRRGDVDLTGLQGSILLEAMY